MKNTTTTNERNNLNIYLINEYTVNVTKSDYKGFYEGITLDNEYDVKELEFSFDENEALKKLEDYSSLVEKYDRFTEVKEYLVEKFELNIEELEEELNLEINSEKEAYKILEKMNLNEIAEIVNSIADLEALNISELKNGFTTHFLTKNGNNDFEEKDTFEESLELFNEKVKECSKELVLDNEAEFYITSKFADSRFLKFNENYYPLENKKKLNL